MISKSGIEKLVESVEKAPPEKRLEAAVKLEALLKKDKETETGKVDTRRAALYDALSLKCSAEKTRLRIYLESLAPAEKVCADAVAAAMRKIKKSRGLCVFKSDGSPASVGAVSWGKKVLEEAARSPGILAELLEKGSFSAHHDLTVRLIPKRECAENKAAARKEDERLEKERKDKLAAVMLPLMRGGRCPCRGGGKEQITATLPLDSGDVAALDSLAREKKTSWAELVREAVAGYVKKHRRNKHDNTQKNRRAD